MNRKTFHIAGFDEQGVRGKPDNLPLVCLGQADGKVAVWGKDTSRRNIDAVLSAGPRCSFEADWIEPPEDFKRKFGHQYWVPETAHLKVIEQGT